MDDVERGEERHAFSHLCDHIQTHRPAHISPLVQHVSRADRKCFELKIIKC